MNKFKTGQVIAYNGNIFRIRLVAEVGFEGDTKPTFYDLIDVKTGTKSVEFVETVDESATLHQETANATK